MYNDQVWIKYLKSKIYEIIKYSNDDKEGIDMMSVQLQ